MNVWTTYSRVKVGDRVKRNASRRSDGTLCGMLWRSREQAERSSEPMLEVTGIGKPYRNVVELTFADGSVGDFSGNSKALVSVAA